MAAPRGPEVWSVPKANVCDMGAGAASTSTTLSTTFLDFNDLFDLNRDLLGHDLLDDPVDGDFLSDDLLDGYFLGDDLFDFDDLGLAAGGQYGGTGRAKSETTARSEQFPAGHAS